MQGHPRGWFVVGAESDFGAAPTTVQAFGRELVFFRDEVGALACVEAHCPHLGAHLGHGGVVVDGTLRCPFHAWAFDRTGACVAIPYATRIPPRARLETFPVRARNGLVFVWHARHGEPPDWEIPVMPEVGAPEYLPWRIERLVVRTHPREIVENVVDIAHFVPVHQTAPTEFENVFEGHRAVQRARGVGSAENKFAGDGYDLTATYYGPGYQITEFRSRGVEARLLNAHTRIDDERLVLFFGVLLRKLPDDRSSERFVAAYVRDLARGFQQDVRIWEHKRYREEPRLAPEDGDIGQLRRWYAQFYEP